MKVRFINALCLLAVCLSISYPAQSTEAPFGLSWGESKSAVENKGINLQASGGQGRVSSYKTNHLPNDLSIAELYTLIFDTEYNLQKIILISKDIDSDIYGSKGKEIFADLKSKLAQKYGNPTSGLEIVGTELYNEQDEFYQCLAYEGCGTWISLYKKQDVSVVLKLNGLGRGKGYITITYEGPNWSNVVDALKQKESELDAKSL